MMRFLYILIIGVLLLCSATYFGLEYWIKHDLKARINSNPDRSYDIDYESIDLNYFFKGIILEKASIIPINVDKDAVTIMGRMDEMNVSGMQWRNLIFGKEVDLAEIVFNEPKFKVLIPPSDSTVRAQRGDAGNEAQNLFKDVLSRGNLANFELVNGRVRLINKKTMQDIASIKRVNIHARNLETDSVRFNYIIPFDVENLEVTLDSIEYWINDHTRAQCKSVYFDKATRFVRFEDASMIYTIPWTDAASKLGFQTDMIQFQLGSLELHRIRGTSKLTGNIDIRAHAIVIDSLVMTDRRDKNIPRPADFEKPMFSAMVSSIPFPIRVDTVMVKNSSISYGEIQKGKDVEGAVTFDNLYGTFYNVTNLPEFQSSYLRYEADLISTVNGSGSLSLRLEVPYDRDWFDLEANLDSMPVEELNETLVPMTGVRAESGMIYRMNLRMSSKKEHSGNNMLLEYDSLKIMLLNEEHDKKEFISSIANSAIRTHNLQTRGKYLDAQYRTERNMYRSPFNLMWASVKEGMMKIVPTKTVQSFIGNPKKKKHKEDKKAKKQNEAR